MNIRLPLFASVSLTAFALTVCGQNSNPSVATPAVASAPTAAPMAAASATPRVIEITANDTMKFSVTAIEAKVGETIKIVLTNTGTLPKEAMGHNLVILKPGSDAAAFSSAAMTAKDKEYIPDSQADKVVAHTIVLGPRKSDEIVLKDLKAGEYPFLCSFPAHYAVGMKGTLTVK